MPNGWDIPTGFSVDLSGLQSGFRKAEAQVKKFGQDVQTAGKKAQTSLTGLSDRLTGLSARFSIVTGAAQQAYQMISQVAGAMVDMAKASDQAEKSARYFSDIMGPLAEQGRSWAQELSDAYGLYTTDVESYMGSLMDAFQRAGNSMSDSYRMAQDFTQLSWDLSAYFPSYDLSEIQDMLLDLARGGGEEALEKLTAGFDEEELKARAVAMGIAEIGEELSVLQKQQAAYDIIMGEYNDMRGLYGETDSATASMNRLDTATKNLKNTLGEVFNPVVEAVGNALAVVVDALDSLIHKISEAYHTIKDFVKDGLNRIANFFGQSDIFDMDSSSVEQATVDTSALEDALNSLDKTAASTQATLQGLAGFDRLYTIKDTGTTDTDVGDLTDWEAAFSDWIAMFQANSPEAAEAMDELWQHMIDSGVTSVDDLKENFGDYFDWMMDSELANTNMTNEEKEALMEEFYANLSELLTDYQTERQAIEAEYQDLINQYELGQTTMTMDEIEAYRQQKLDALDATTRTLMGSLATDLMHQFGLVSDDLAYKMQMAFKAALDTIQEAYKAAFDTLRNEANELNKIIEDLWFQIQAAKNAASSIKTPSIIGSITDELGNIWDVATSDKTWDEAQDDDPHYLPGLAGDLGFFAEGGLFPPNSPQLVVMGDNRVEPEVAAPRSLIEEAVQNVITRNGGLSGSSDRPIEVRMTLELDGKVLARQLYKYNGQVATQKGTRA